MPAKMPYIQWFPADWLAATTMLTPATRGIWFDILNAMWLMDRAEKISGTLPELARAGRCDAVQMQTAIDELTRFHVADVTERNGFVTVVCRRFKKANNERVRIREAVKKSRCNASVTEMLQRDNTEYIVHNRHLSFDANASSDKSRDTANADVAGNAEKPKKPKTGTKIFFDYNGDRRLHGITSEQLADWREFYDALNVEAELRQASAWLDANRRKIDIKRFLVNWLNKAQDRARNNNNGSETGKLTAFERARNRQTGILTEAPEWASDERGLAK